MNDVTFGEASRRLAQRVMLEGGARPEARLRLAFRLVLARTPSAAEMSVLADNLAAQRDRFRSEPGAALDFVSAGESPRDEQLPVEELAAYAAVCGLILNLDEAITKP